MVHRASVCAARVRSHAQPWPRSGKRGWLLAGERKCQSQARWRRREEQHVKWHFKSVRPGVEYEHPSTPAPPAASGPGRCALRPHCGAWPRRARLPSTVPGPAVPGLLSPASPGSPFPVVSQDELGCPEAPLLRPERSGLGKPPLSFLTAHCWGRRPTGPGSLSPRLCPSREAEDKRLRNIQGG